jgi:hypothetical protein
MALPGLEIVTSPSGEKTNQLRDLSSTKVNSPQLKTENSCLLVRKIVQGVRFERTGIQTIILWFQSKGN